LPSQASAVLVALCCQKLLLYARMGEPFGWLSPAFRPVAFTLRFRTILRTYRHHFLFAQADVVRPRAWDARPPASCGETEPPDADFLRPDPVVALISEPFARVLADFSRVRFSSPVARLSPRGSQGHTGQVTIFGQVTSRLLRSACYPCQFRLAALPDRLPSCVRIPTCKTFPGIRWRNESTNLCTRLSASAA